MQLGRGCIPLGAAGHSSRGVRMAGTHTRPTAPSQQDTPWLPSAYPRLLACMISDFVQLLNAASVAVSL